MVRIGDDESGVFEIEKRGYLTVAEKTFVDNFTQNPELMRNLVRVCGVIASRYKKPKEECFKAIQTVLSGGAETKLEKDIEANYQDEIGDLTAQMADIQTRRTIAAATVLIQCRIDADWALEDTLGLEQQVIEQLCELYDSEEAKIKPKEEDSDQEVRELVGK